MKTRTLLTLLLSIGLTVSGIAQTSSGSSAQPTTSTDQSAAATSATEAPLPAASTDFWDGEEPSLGALITHPFATKEYVRRHVQPIRDRVDELEEITESNQKTTRDVDARAQQGIQMASAKASVADQHATDAAGKAQMADQTASALGPRLTRDETVVANLDQYKSGQQTEIRFRAGQTVLSKEAKDALDEMAAQLKDQRGFILEVQGFSSGHGQAAIARSRTVADAVVRYLVLNHEIPAYRIYVLAMGNAGTHAGGIRVEVNLMKSDIEQTAKQ
jgi:outer membrane protein OmpA-like peptidoglycan-associated protein